MKQPKGFTLIEMIITIVLTGILFGLASRILTVGFTSYTTAKRITDAINPVNICLNNLMRELKSAQSMDAIGATGFTFTNQQGQSIAISFGSNTLSRSVNSATAQILCNQITTLGFSFYDQGFTTTATAANVRFVTAQISMTINGLPYGIMGGTLLRALF